ncbi:prepilin-type N-terminal cleavage/methylation domain-containing protein [bacterium]|nr:prepilin-type N-terminal cleavage/methylation domain-containing protein [bacterium]
MQSLGNKNSGFTLIELLIVVAIIAILAAIAVPNFLEAQTRAKTSRIKADVRTLATAMESYRVTFNRYPPDAGHGAPPYSGVESLIPLSTPVSFITSIPRDPFQEVDNSSYFGYYFYVHDPDLRQLPASENGTRFYWILFSVGPDRDSDQLDFFPVTHNYDPTNGTISDGDIGRWGP